MNKPSDVRVAIQAVLDALHPRCFFQAARGKPEHPYAVYDLVHAFNDGDIEVFSLELDGWDDSKDSTRLETMMETIDGDDEADPPAGLHRRVLNVPDKVLAVIYRDTRDSDPDETDQILHRRYTYQVRAIN